MTAIRAAAAPSLALRAVLIGGGLVALVLARRVATTSIAGDGIAAGVAFGIGLLGLAAAAGIGTAIRADRDVGGGLASRWGRVTSGARRPRLARGVDARALPQPAAIAIGLAGAVPLVALALAAPGPAIVMFGSGAPFVPWAIATAIVACGEEFVLRGVLFDAVGRLLGGPAAVVVTSAAFALMHVPTYGWQVVPLDLGVGLWLAGLRLVSGGVAAPAVAHLAADLVTWWL